MNAIGNRRWVIAEGYIPQDTAPPRGSTAAGDSRFESHETACIVNTGSEDADVSITIFFADREPVGPYRLTVPARRTLHARFNDLEDPEPIPRETDYASVIESSVPVVVQHTRLDSRRSALALITTLAHGAPQQED